MADRTIKPDSGNDLVLQNNGGGTKIEIPNSGDIAITGTIGSGTFSGTIGSSANMPSGTVIKMGQTKFTADAYQANSTSYSSFVTAGAFTPNGGPNNTSTIYPIVTSYITTAHTSSSNNRSGIKYKITGDDITDVTLDGTTLGGVDYGSSGLEIRYWFNTYLQGVTLDGTGNADILVSVAVSNGVASSDKSITFFGNNTFDESFVTFIEVV